MTRRDASEMRVQGDTNPITEIVGPKQDDDDDDHDDDFGDEGRDGDRDGRWRRQ
jgi:hypothetical protein